MVSTPPNPLRTACAVLGGAALMAEAAAAPPGPPGIPAGSPTGGFVALSWSPAADDESVTGYNVYRDDEYLATVSGSTYRAALGTGGTSRFYVTAFDTPAGGGARGYSTRSPVAVIGRSAGSGFAPAGASTAPAGLVATRAGGGSTRLRWNVPGGGFVAEGYNVYRDDRYLTTVRGTAFEDRAPVAGRAHVYYLVAFDAARNFGPRSNVATATTGSTGGGALPGDGTPGDGTIDDGAIDDGGALPSASPPTLDAPFADAIPSPNPRDPFGFTLETDGELPVAGGPPTRPKNLRLDLVSYDWAEFSWAPANDDVGVVAYEVRRDDGATFMLTPALPAGTVLDPGTYEEYEKYWKTTSFIDCNPTRFAFRPGSAKAAVAPWNCAEIGPRPGDDRVYTVVAIDGDGQRSPASEPLEIAYSELIDSPVPFYDDLYLGPGDRFASVTDLSRVPYFLDDFELVFDEEFDGGAVDASKWNTGLVWGDSRIINGEQQYFVDVQREPGFGHDPFDFANGEDNAGALDGRSLSIRASPIPDDLRASLPPVCEAPDPTGLDRCEFLSGALSSHDRFRFIYGYVEARIKPSATPGALSSFYLYHRYAGTGVLRHGPEIDILEYLGENPFGDPDAFQTYHFIDPNTGIIRSSPTMNHEKADGGVYGGDYHTYGVLWEPQLLVWYIDGREIGRIRGPQVSRQPMNLVTYLVAGSGWAPTPDVSDASIFPLDMGIDYVRVYQREAFAGTATFGR